MMFFNLRVNDFAFVSCIFSLSHCITCINHSARCLKIFFVLIASLLKSYINWLRVLSGYFRSKYEENVKGTMQSSINRWDTGALPAPA